MSDFLICLLIISLLDHWSIKHLTYGKLNTIRSLGIIRMKQMVINQNKQGKG